MLGKCKTVTLTSPANITADVIISGSANIGASVEELFGQEPLPIVTVGNIDCSFNFVTTDVSVTGLMQGQKVEGLTMEFACVGTDVEISGTNVSITADADVLKYELSHGYVSDVVEIAADNGSKSAAQYSVTIKACLSGEETATTIKRTFTAGAGGE